MGTKVIKTNKDRPIENCVITNLRAAASFKDSEFAVNDHIWRIAHIRSKNTLW